MPASSISSLRALDEQFKLKSVVFCADVPWDRPHSGTYSYFLRLIQLTSAIYVDPPLTILHMGRRPGIALELWRRIRQNLVGASTKRLTHQSLVYRPMPMLPSGMLRAASSDAYYRSLGKRLRSLLSDQGIDRCVLWTCDPSSHAVAQGLRPDLVIYHCIQDFGAARLPWPIRELKISQEIKLAREADHIFAQTPGLVSRLRSWNKSTHWFPSAVDTDLFNPERAAHLAEPQDLASLPSPRLCWVGMASRAVDYELLIDTARSMQRGTMVVIGAIQQADPRFRRLVSLANVKYLGFKNHALLPSYLAHVDVCLIPYVDTDFVRGVSSQKLYEYFAMGCKVVATSFPESSKYSDGLWLAKNRSDFVALVGEALSDSGREKQNAAMAIAKVNSLDTRFAAMMNLMRDTGAAMTSPKSGATSSD